MGFPLLGLGFYPISCCAKLIFIIRSYPGTRLAFFAFRTEREPEVWQKIRIIVSSLNRTSVVARKQGVRIRLGFCE